MKNVNQHVSNSDICPRCWNVYEMITDFYTKFPDPLIKIVVEESDEDEDDGGKIIADKGKLHKDSDSDQGG